MDFNFLSKFMPRSDRNDDMSKLFYEAPDIIYEGRLSRRSLTLPHSSSFAPSEVDPLSIFGTGEEEN